MATTVVTSQTLADFSHLRDFGYTVRRPTHGPELELVNDFVQYCLPSHPRGQVRTVFVEPRLDSGYPDAVVAYLHLATAERWQDARANLSASDVRILHYLSSYGAAEFPVLRTILRHGVHCALERLHAAGLVRYVNQTWQALPLHRIFAIRRLIAIEAKIDAWRSGLTQALQNTWFASESYLLMPRIPKRSPLIQEAARFGLGVVTQGQPLRHAEIPARPEGLPKSHASWLFNEWAWRTCIE